MLPSYVASGAHRRVAELAGGATPDGRYLHWDHLRHRVPPEGLTREEWWLGIKLARSPLYQVLPLRARDGDAFVLSLLPGIEAALERLDDETRGQGAVAARALGEDDRERALMDEAISSAQMDGAAIGAEQARALLSSGRQPRTRSERIVADTWDGLQLVREVSDEPLTPELFMEIHRTMTARTLERGEAGRLRQPHEAPVVYALRGEDLFDPPIADELPERLPLLCAFANGEIPDWPVHPVLRGLLVHLWVAYEHPCVDGNGRVARALFNWAMASQGYPLYDHLPLSRVLRREKSNYERALLFTTTDGFDATYFVLLLLGALAEAIDGLQQAIAPLVGAQPVFLQPDLRGEAGVTLAPVPAKHPQATLIEQAMRAGGALNERQLALVERALRHPEEVVTVKSHQKAHKVAYGTARLDLQDLFARGLVRRTRVGRAWEFQTVSDVADRLFGPMRRG